MSACVVVLYASNDLPSSENAKPSNTTVSGCARAPRRFASALLASALFFLSVCALYNTTAHESLASTTATAIVVVPACPHIALTRRTSFGSGRNRCASLDESDTTTVFPATYATDA